MPAKQLSELEQEIMDHVWGCGRCTVSEIKSRLKRKLAYTTVATMLQRLHHKGLLTRRKNGSVLSFFPRITKESYSKNLAQSFIHKFFDSFGDVGIASFAGTLDNLPKKKRDYLLRLLEKHGQSQ